MPKKNRQTPKTQVRAKTSPRKIKQAQPKARLKKSARSIKLTFAHPRQALPHLLSLASEIADKHFANANFTATLDDVLGTDRACQIVSGCADSDCWTCTLADLKLDSDVFQTCVFNGVQSKGYFIPRNQIPASQTTQLYTVVMAIQNAKRKENA
jgi:hypothetical protein